MKWTRVQKDEAIAYWAGLRDRLAARLVAINEGRLDDALPPSRRSVFWQTIDAQALRDVIDDTDLQIEILRKRRCID